MCRRGGFRSDERILPADIDGMVRSLREADTKVEGIQPVKKPEKVNDVGACPDLSLFEEPPGLTREKARQPDGAEITGAEGAKGKDRDGIRGLFETGDEDEIMIVRNRNQALPGAPGDFALFDFSEMERIGGELLNARDSWVHTTIPAPLFQFSGNLTPQQREVEVWWSARQPEVATDIQTFLKNRMAIGETGGDLDKKLRHALIFPQQKGTSRDSQLAMGGLISLDTVQEDEPVDENHVGEIPSLSSPGQSSKWKIVRRKMCGLETSISTL